MINRQSNFELLRLIAMMMVLLLHCNYACLGGADINEIRQHPLTAYVRVFLEHACLSGVNIFILISGWFGIKFRPRGIISLLFNVLFLGWLLAVLLIPVGISIPLLDMMKLTYFGSYYWFVPSYILLFICAPLLNSFAENARKKELAIFLVAFFIFEFALGWFWDYENYGYGYSCISFIGLYMTARYLHMYEKDLSLMKLRKGICFLLYTILTIIPATAAFILTKNGIVFNQLSYSSPFVIGAAISLLLLFRQIDLRTNEFVNSCAASAFSMYLIQLHPMLWPLWLKNMTLIQEKYGIGFYLLASIVICLVFSVICILIDKIRIFTWQQILRLYESINKRI